MGLEADCRARIDGRARSGRARLESATLEFRAASERVVIPLASVRSALAKAGLLEVRHAGGRISLELGAAAERWALRIRYPKPRIDKLGVKPGSRVALLGLDDDEFLAELRERGAEVSAGRARPGTDLAFVRVELRPGLARLRTLRAALRPEGAIWVLWPKGRKELREDDVRAAGAGFGLVDVKVVSFSDRLSALKLVIPVALRPARERKGADGR